MDARGDGHVVERPHHCQHQAALPDTAVVTLNSMTLVVEKFVKSVENPGESLLGLALLRFIILSALMTWCQMTTKKH